MPANSSCVRCGLEGENIDLATGLCRVCEFQRALDNAYIGRAYRAWMDAHSPEPERKPRFKLSIEE